MSFLTEITALVGTPATSTEVDAAMTAGCADVVRRVAITNPEDLWLFTKEASVEPDGRAIGSGRIYDVSRGDRNCTLIQPSLRHSAADVNSIEYATSEYPVYYLLNSKIFILPRPEPDGEEELFNITLFEAVSVGDNANERTKITTSGGDSSGLHGFIVGDYATISQSTSGGETYYVGGFRVIDVPSTETFVIEKDYSADNSDETGYKVEKAVGKARYIDTHIINSTDTSAYTEIANFPSSYYRYPVLYSAMSVLMTRMDDINNDMPTITVGEAPISPSLESTQEALPTYVAPSAVVMPSSPQDVDLDYSSIGAPPSMGTIEQAVMPILSFDISDITFSENLSISEAPVPPLAEDGGSGVLDFSLVRAKKPLYTPPVFSAPSFPTITSLSLPSAPPPPAIDTSLNSGANVDFQVASTAGSQPSLTVPVLGALDYTVVNDYIVTEEDSELAGAKLQEIQAKLGEFQASLSSEQVKFNREMEIYRAKITEEMEEVKAQIGKENSEAQLQLSEYGAKTQAYQIDVNNKIAEWTKNNLELSMAKWIQEYEKGLNKYQADMANSMNSFNEQVGEYQSEISKATADATNTLSADNNMFGRKLQSYQGDVEAWKLKVNKEITDWQTTVVTPVMTKFAQMRAENLQQWQNECNNELQSWANRIQQEQQVHGAAMAKWQAEFGQITTKFQSETGYDLNKFQADVQSAVQKYQSDTDLEGNKFKSGLEKYNAEVQSVNTSNNQNQQKFQGDLASYQAKVQADLGKYQADIQKLGIQYKWFADKYMILKQEYNEGFIPKPQQEGV